jgi:probable addiction module antidote protein
MTKYRKLDEYLIESLKDEKEAKHFLNAALDEFQEDNDMAALSNALDLLIRAQGSISQLSKSTNISRTHIHRIINNETQPTLSTITAILKSLGFKLSVKKAGKLKFAH